MTTAQFARNEARMLRACDRIAKQWRDAYSTQNKAGMHDADVRYCKALHVRNKVLSVYA